ncbi:uncharacterized protein RCC_03287 [Ramularia collo-cygni]|uniref:Coenzyme Q-binding protein COQ10 START domain-containing protein n=1 Tax=Ramularia collo-cygni TaxID=112498 RepID=A0A2D3VAJ4_9PEZI|nr:uncharacterized protein RCC_03287 [Ramularia collo-cygni]CZT17453.1 uncharacterized protein RCC_03287 [Ramularia collo-cygni]
MPFSIPSSLLHLLLITSTITIQPTQAFQLAPSTFTHTQCSDNPLLGTPTYGNAGIVFTTCSQRDISASRQEIYDAILDFSEYKNWNSFVVDVRDRKGGEEVEMGVREDVGFAMRFTTRGLLPGGVNTSSDEVVTFAEREVKGEEDDGRKTAAVSGWRFEGVGQQAEHVNVLRDLGGGVTR